MASNGSQDVSIFLNSKRVSGVQDMSFQQSVSDTLQNTLGNDLGTPHITAPTTTTFSLDRYLLNTDFITGLTGQTFSGMFVHGTNTTSSTDKSNFLKFNSGVLMGYSVDCSIGQIPTIAYDIEIFGQITGDSASGITTPTDETALSTMSPTGITVTFDKENKDNQNNKNLVQSFVFTERFEYEPIYAVGSRYPTHLVSKGPVFQEMDINMEVENYNPEDTHSFLDSDKDKNRNISVKMQTDDGQVNTFSLTSGHLLSESLNYGVNNTVTASLKYRGYKRKTSDLS